MVFSSNELDMLILQNGEDGIPADSKYIWVKYSQNANGIPLTDNPTNAVYIGIAYNKDSIEESNNPSDYSWSKILGDKGDDAYTIILSNENISFSVSYENNLAIGDQSFTTDVRVFYGADERDDFVIGEIGSSNGITVSKTVNSVTLSVTDNTKITAKHGYFRIPISIDGMIFYKDMSWNTVPQGAPGSVGQPALNISLGNESQNIPCNSEGVTLESFLIEIPFAAYEGFNKVACTASVGVLPSGITLGQNTGSTPDTDGLIILNVARGSNLGGDEVLQGKVVITFIIGESEVIKNFTWTKTKDGATGEAGQFTLYSLESSAPVISKTFDDTFSPESITFSAYSMEGNSGDKTEYSGMFIIEESTNGTTYDTSYLSSADEQSVTFTPTSINVISIRCTLYKAGGITSALDIYTVPVLTDVDNMRPIIDEITTSISGVETKVDSVEKSITDKVWQSDITTQINNYDNTTVKIIRDQVAETQTSLGEIRSTVSDVQTTLTTKADGSTVQTLSEKVSNIEQDANGFRQTVEKNYVTNDDLDENSKTLRSEFNQTASEINQTVTDLSGDVTTITQNVASINQKVADAEGNISSLQQTSNSLQSQIETAQGDISNIQQTAGGLQSQITDNKNNISQLEQDVEGFKTTVSSQLGSLETSIEENSESIKLSASKIEEIEKKKVVSSSVPYFYLSDSNTELIGGSWTTTPPGWSEGKYYWQKTVTTYSDGSTVESTPICVTGNKGSDGTGVTILGSYDSEEELKQAHPTGNPGDAYMIAGDLYVWDAANSQWKNVGRIQGEQGDAGPAGRSIVSVTVEFYLSTSKTTQTGGSWSETVPTWETGKYLWTRNKIVYKNPSSTEYTAPVCDSSWEVANEVADDLHNNYYNKTETEALISVESDRITSTVKETVVETVAEEVGNIQIGGRNLLKNSSLRENTNLWENNPQSMDTIAISQTEKNNQSCTLIDSSSLSQTEYHFWQKIDPGKLELNATYTASAWILAENVSVSNIGTTGYCQFEFTKYQTTGAGNLHYHPYVLDTDGYSDWARVYWTFTVTNSVLTTDTNLYFGLQLKNTTGDFYIRDLQLEKGNTATDWTPASEDLATVEEVQNAQTSADEANATANSNESRVTVAESTIQQLSDAISTLVVDENGESMMTQTSDGWRFDMSNINSQLSTAQNQLNDLAGDMGQIDQTINNLNDLANDLVNKTAYIVMTTDSTGSPCIELGKSDNQFKLRITNTSIDFMEGSSRIAYIDNQTLYIERAVIKNELQIGEGTGFIWKKRSNRNMGLRWIG